MPCVICFPVPSLDKSATSAERQISAEDSPLTRSKLWAVKFSKCQRAHLARSRIMIDGTIVTVRREPCRVSTLS